MTRLRFRAAIATLLAGLLLLAASPASVAEAPGLLPAAALFEEHEPLSAVLSTDLGALRGRKAEPLPIAGMLMIEAGEAWRASLDVGVTRRGGFRADKSNCRFPQLMLHLDPEAARGTILAGQTALALVTQCRYGSERYEQYLITEYLVYRTYQLLTDASLRVRLARVVFEDSGKSRRKSETGFAFLVEHFETLARRRGSEVTEIEGFHPLDADPGEMGLLDLFQFMIGNTDWSVPFQHNILLLRDPDGLVTAVPFDFDWSGMVDTHYARPSPKLEIRSVRERVYRGMCQPREALTAAMGLLERREPDIRGLFQTASLLSEPTRTSALGYLDGFYALLDSAAGVQRMIFDACRGTRATPLRKPGL